MNNLTWIRTGDTIACIHVLGGGGGGLLGVGVGGGGDVFAKGTVCQGSGVKHHMHKLYSPN